MSYPPASLRGPNLTIPDPPYPEPTQVVLATIQFRQI